MSWEGFFSIVIAGSALAVAMRNNIHLARMHDRNRERFDAHRGRLRRVESRMNAIELEAEGLREVA